MVVESPPSQEQRFPQSTPRNDASKGSVQAGQSSGTDSNPTAVSEEPSANGMDGSGNDSNQQSNPMANGVASGYPYPAMYAGGPTGEMYHGAHPSAMPRMYHPMAPYPYPPPGQASQPMPPHAYPYPMMAPNGGQNPTSPTSGPMQMPPYMPPYGMWYPSHPMGMPPPQGMPPQGMPPQGIPNQNGLPPMPATMPPYPQQPAHSQQQSSDEGQPSAENATPPQASSNSDQTAEQSWASGPGGLPPKEVARHIPCRYFPDCRFGTSCWFIHPGEQTGQTPPPSSETQETQAPRPYFPGPLPPPVQYNQNGPWDPNQAPAANGVGEQSNQGYTNGPSGANTNGYPPPPVMYPAYGYPPNGYLPMYPPPIPHSNQAPAGQQNQSQPGAMSPTQQAQTLQQPSQSPHQSAQPIPSQPMNVGPGAWYPTSPGSFPPQSMHPHAHPNMPPQGMHPVPMSPVSPGGIPNGAMNRPPGAMSPPPGHPVPYPLSPSYSTGPHQLSPSQQIHPLSPPHHPGSPQSVYGGHAPLPPSGPPPGHSRRESMSSMSAVAMGSILGPHLDGNGNVDGTRSPRSVIRDAGETGFRRNSRGGHMSRGSFSSHNGFSSGARKPPCLFYPTGRCKNGSDCRFPHVMPGEDGTTSPRSTYPGSFGRATTGRRPIPFGGIEEKLAEVSLKEQEGGDNVDANNRQQPLNKPYSSSPKNRGGRPPISTPSTPGGRHNTHLQQPHPAQKIPSPDDFPVLGGTATPPHPNGQVYGVAWGGPTAAQVLKAGIVAGKKAITPGGNASSDGGKEPKSSTEEELQSAPVV